VKIFIMQGKVRKRLENIRLNRINNIKNKTPGISYQDKGFSYGCSGKSRLYRII